MLKRNPYNIVVKDDESSVVRGRISSDRFWRRYLNSLSSTVRFGWKKPARIDLTARSSMSSRYRGHRYYRNRRSPGAGRDPRLWFQREEESQETSRQRRSSSFGGTREYWRDFGLRGGRGTGAMTDRGRWVRMSGGDRVYRCEVCGREGFSRRTSLMRHYRLVHPDEGDERMRGRSWGIDAAGCGAGELCVKEGQSKKGSSDLKELQSTTKKGGGGEEFVKKKPEGRGEDRGRAARGVRSSTLTVEERELPGHDIPEPERKSTEGQTREDNNRLVD
jgi:hypothetical protein